MIASDAEAKAALANHLVSEAGAVTAIPAQSFGLSP
jgi:hypothetical protein